jgi:hypothetical protein
VSVIPPLTKGRLGGGVTLKDNNNLARVQCSVIEPHISENKK